MSASNIPSKSPSTSKRRPVMIIAMFPVGVILGFLGGLLIEIIVGLIARAVFSAEHPAAFSMRFLGFLPGLGLFDRRDPGAHPVRPRCVVVELSRVEQVSGSRGKAVCKRRRLE
jgi:hypothetical protein